MTFVTLKLLKCWNKSVLLISSITLAQIWSLALGAVSSLTVRMHYAWRRNKLARLLHFQDRDNLLSFESKRFPSLTRIGCFTVLECGFPQIYLHPVA